MTPEELITLSQRAAAATRAAAQGCDDAGNSCPWWPKNHKLAAQLHLQAAVEHSKAGNTIDANAHAREYAYHNKLANE